jgi:hypothetical protein
MATVLESLKSISSYPIPQRTIEEISVKRNLTLNDTVSQNILKSTNYMLAKADLLMWLSLAPNVSQGGQNYSFTDQQRLLFRQRANAIYDMYEDEEMEVLKPAYGYKGSRL